MASRVLSTCLITPPTKFTHAPPVNFSNKASWFRSKNGRIKCGAVGDSSQPVYNGVYGPWTVESSDVRERCAFMIFTDSHYGTSLMRAALRWKGGYNLVISDYSVWAKWPGKTEWNSKVILYRSGLVTAASSFVLAASYAFLPSDSQLSEIIKQNLDLLYTLGAGGLGLSLFLIHIYVTEIKRTLQAFWALGAIGSLATCTNLAQPAGENLIQYVVDNPIAVWFVGPLFAALTGLVFKEGLCYGKLEAGILTFIIPTVLLGHLTGLMDDGVKLALLASWMTLFVIFAGRKFTQPIKDDIGDKSVFMFNSLPDDEKKALIKKLEQQ
ncbi:F3H9.20 PROTEIN [Salix purpurea]|uniref:F3H9.20 PROTEIN n=1 Tax=Salix purpurea TaxID=77065 RepID=A0A9Q0YWD2_SALPP|nr:F3H9.20 PROTEIN [Salix purpurea]